MFLSKKGCSKALFLALLMTANSCAVNAEGDAAEVEAKPSRLQKVWSAVWAGHGKTYKISVVTALVAAVVSGVAYKKGYCLCSLPAKVKGWFKKSE